MAGIKGRSGRKSKAAELGLPRLLDKAFPIAERLELFRTLHNMARDGNMEALKLLLAYTYGKPSETHNVVGTQTIVVSYGVGASNTRD